MKKILDRVAEEHEITKENLVKVLQDNSINDYLFSLADEVRKNFVGDEVHLRGLIEASNFCKRTCFYCGLRRENKTINRYRLSCEKIFELARKAVDLNFKTVVIQSGEDDFYTKEKMCELLKKLSQLDLVITLSLGEKTFEEYKLYKDFGAKRYLLRIETSDKELYKKLHPKMSFENRLSCLKHLKTLGYETGTGSLIGLPNQSINSIADDILFFKKIDADMVGVGAFLPAPNTPLADCDSGNFNLTIKTISLTRLLLPYANIPATTAIETLKPNGRMIALNSGANVVMPNITDEVYRQEYKIYPDKAGINVSTAENLLELKNMLEKSNRPISKGYGGKNNT